MNLHSHSMIIAMEWRVENACESDWIRIREICVQASPAAQALIGKRKLFFEDFWIEPYQRLRPGWTWVLRSGNDPRVLGYLTAAPDTVNYSRQRVWSHRSRLLQRWISGRYGKMTPELRRWIRRSLRLDPDPEKIFGREVAQELIQKFPAHLHMNLDSAAQGRGGGRLLIQALETKMKQEGILGVHLFCGTGPIGFYERCGFQVRGRKILPRTTSEVLVMIRTLSTHP